MESAHSKNRVSEAVKKKGRRASRSKPNIKDLDFTHHKT